MKPAAGGFDNRPSSLAAIDWSKVGPLAEDERLSNEPGHPGTPAQWPIATHARSVFAYAPTLALWTWEGEEW
jgi:hypothetical protein